MTRQQQQQQLEKKKIINKNNKNKNPARDNHIYVNFHKQLVKIVDNYVASILINGAPKYTSRKDFFVKAIQNQIEREKKQQQQNKEAPATN